MRPNKERDTGNVVGRLASSLVILVALSVWGAAITSAQTLSLDNQTAAAVGESVTFALSIDYPASESGEIQAVTIDVNFDHAVLTYDGHTRGSLVANWSPFDVSNPQDGPLLKIAGLTLTAGDGIEPGDSGAIVQLQFTVVAMDDATLTISAQDDLASFATRSGQFTFERPPANNAPVAMDDEAETDAGESVVINILANDREADGDRLTITNATDGNNGTVAVAADGASVTYTPNADFAGEDQFMYTVSDGQGGTDTATVMVDVMEVDDGDGDGDGGTTDSGGGGCTLNPGTPFDPTLISILALFMGIHFVRRFTRRQSLR